MNFIFGMVFATFVGWMYLKHGKVFASLGLLIGLGSFLLLTLSS
jgi:hypothetical protein